MTVEMSNEDKVTQLLVSAEILKPKSSNFYISSPDDFNLNNYLFDYKEESSSTKIKENGSKYSFIDFEYNK